MNLQSIIQSTIIQRLKSAHRVPGRLRLSVPELALLPGGFEEHAATARTILEKLPGMKSVSINAATRNILFLYDTSVASESEVLGWIESLLEDGIGRLDELMAGSNMHTTIYRILGNLKSGVEDIRNNHASTEKN